MKLGFLIAAAALSVSAPALAQDDASLRNAVVVDSSGKAVGKVNRVVMAGDVVSGVQLIVGSKMVTLDAGAYTIEGGVVKSTLSKREIERK